jgi:hypothetical protein
MAEEWVIGSAAFHKGLVVQPLVGQRCKWMHSLNATLSHGVRESRPVRDVPLCQCWRGKGLLDQWSETLQKVF